MFLIYLSSLRNVLIYYHNIMLIREKLARVYFFEFLLSTFSFVYSVYQEKHTARQIIPMVYPP